MASNPVNAFLQGFAVVDQLETNRQNREINKQQLEFNKQKMAFATEEQSQVRKMWKETNDSFARANLDRFREQKLAELDAAMAGILKDPNTSAEMLADPWLIAQKAADDMMATDGSLGELLALAADLDPAAGELVTNKANPVAGLKFISPDKDPAGKGGVAFILNTANGKQPYTDGRTSDPEDPVTVESFDRTKMLKTFGPALLNGKYFVSKMLLDLDGPEPARQPSAKAPEAKAPEAKAPEAKAPEPDSTHPELLRHQKIALEDQQDIEDLNPTFKPAGDVTAFDAIKELQGPAVLGGPIGVAKGLAIAADGIADIAANIPGVLRYEGAKAKNAWVDFSYGVANAVNNALGIESDISRENSVKDRVKQHKVERAAARDAIRTEAIERASQVPAEDRKTLAKIGTDPGAIADAVLTAPVLTEAGMQSAASAVLSTRGRPKLQDMANAVSLLKMNVITPAQLINYRDTGQFNQQAKAQLNLVTDTKSGITTVFENGVPRRQVQTGSGVSDIDSDRQVVADRSAVRKLQIDTVENTFFDRETGKVNQQYLQSYMDVQDGVFNIAGVGSRDARRTEPSFLRSIAAGSKFVSRFNEDDIQLFDLSWGDVEVPHTAGNVAIGQVADEVGITSQEEATYFLRDYADTLRKGIDARNDTWFVNEVRKAEKWVEEARTIPSHPEYEIYKDMDQREARTEYVKRSVVEANAQAR